MKLKRKILEGIDEGVRELVIAMNEIEGIETVTSCEGHEEGRVGQHFSWVMFKARDLESLHRFQEKITFDITDYRRYHTVHQERTGEYYSGYWVEVFCDYIDGAAQLFFVLMIHSS